MAEEKEGRPLRAILGERLDRAAAELEGDAVGDPSSWPDCKTDWARRTGPWATPPRRRRCSRRPSGSARTSWAPTTRTRSRSCPSRRRLSTTSESQAMPYRCTSRCGTPRRTFSVPIAGDTLSTEQKGALAYWRAERASDACTLMEQVQDGLLKLRPRSCPALEALDNLSGRLYVSSARTGQGHRPRPASAGRPGEEIRRRPHPRHRFAEQSRPQISVRRKNGQALALFEEARDGLVPRLGPDHPNTLMMLDSLAGMYRSYGRTRRRSPGPRGSERRVMTLGPTTRTRSTRCGTWAWHMWPSGGRRRLWPCSGRRRPGWRSSSSRIRKPERSSQAYPSVSSRSGGSIGRMPGGGSGWRRRKRGRAGLRSSMPGSWRTGENCCGAKSTPTRNRSCASARPSSRRKSPGTGPHFTPDRCSEGPCSGRRATPRPNHSCFEGYDGLKARQGQIPRLYARHDVARRPASGSPSSTRPGAEAEKAAEWRTKLPGQGEAGHRP